MSDPYYSHNWIYWTERLETIEDFSRRWPSGTLFLQLLSSGRSMEYMGVSTRRRRRRIVDGVKCTKYDLRGGHYQQAASTVVPHME